MTFCCQPTKNHFDFRNECGFFLFTAAGPVFSKLRFYHGYTTAHNEDHTDGVEVSQTLMEAMHSAGISNFKPLAYSVVRFCPCCGKDLSDYYGPEGGALRDDEFLRRLRN